MTRQQRRHTDPVMRGSEVRSSVVKPPTTSCSSSSSSQVTSSCCSAVTIRKHTGQQTSRSRGNLGQTCEQNQAKTVTVRHCNRRKASLPTSDNNETNRNKMARKKRNDSFSRWSLSLNMTICFIFIFPISIADTKKNQHYFFLTLEGKYFILFLHSMRWICRTSSVASIRSKDSGVSDCELHDKMVSILHVNTNRKALHLQERKNCKISKQRKTKTNTTFREQSQSGAGALRSEEVDCENNIPPLTVRLNWVLTILAG